MLAIDREVKDAIESAERKNLILAFDDGTTIDNDDIALESMELEQSISEEDILTFGGINSACFKVKIKGTTKEYKNLWFNASLNVGDYTHPLGRFLVNSDVATSDRQYRDIVAYDSLYTAMNTDVSEWYNGLTFPISVYDMRNSLFEYLGIEQVETELINDNYLVEKTIEGTGITGHKVLQAICELNAVFGVINAYGKFKYVQIKTYISALYPSEDLYPSDDLYPEDIYDDRLTKSDYRLGSLTYEEFETQNITKVLIHEMENDLGVSVGEDGNTYTIEDNFLVYGDTEENLTVVAQNIFDYVKNLTYTPASLKCNGKPWREVGDMIQVYANDRVFHMPIMNRVLKGIQALTDTYSAQGRETYDEQQEVGYKAEIKQLKSRTNVLTRTLDETNSTITRIENENEEYKTEISQKFDEINLEVESKVNEEELIAKINLAEGVVELIGNRIIIKSDNFKLTEEGSIEMLSGKIKIQGTVRKLASDYTESDLERANSISLGNIYPTVSDLEKLDLNGDGVITIADIIRINSLLQGTYEYWDIPTSIEINPLATQNIITTDGVSIGMNGGFLKTINSQNGYFENIYVMNTGSGYSKGATGSFVDGSGNTVTVINGIITSIL